VSQELYYYLDEKIFEKDEKVFINKTKFNNKINLHAHDFIEIAYVASGKGIHKVGKSHYSISKGDVFIINYNVPHEFIPEPELLVYNCIFTPAFLDLALVSSKDFFSISHHFLFSSLFPEEKELESVMVLNHDNLEIEELYDKMLREFLAKDDGYIEILRAYVIELLIIIFRTLKKSSILGDRTENNRKQLIEKVMKYMKDKHSKEMKIEELSMMAFLSPSHFCRLFKEYTGLTVSEYSQKLRIEEACRLLKSSDKKVIDVAADVGYRDIKHFNQVFKKIAGKTPRDYRKL